MTLRWIDEPWAKNPDPLLETLEALYLKAISLGKIQSPAKTTAKKLKAIRGWCDAVSMDAIEATCATLEILYIPADVAPGPGILFPIRDVTGEIRRAHIRVNDDALYGVRYISAVNKDRFIGPPWFGNDEDTIASIIKHREVVVVEGPMDLAACRIVAPDVPSLCPLTKRLGQGHLDYLRVLGVTKIRPMFDNQKSGKDATEAMIRKLTDFTVEPLLCPSSDPAVALKTTEKVRQLRDTLRSVFRGETPHVFVDDQPLLGGF